MLLDELSDLGFTLTFADAHFYSYGHCKVVVQFDYLANGIERQPRFEAIVKNVEEVERARRIEDPQRRHELLYIGIAYKIEQKIMDFLEELEHEEE
jgi:hypothetical protein